MDMYLVLLIRMGHHGYRFINPTIIGEKWKRKRKIYRNHLKNREFGKEAPQNFDSERATIAERQGASENHNSEGKPTPPKTDSSSCFGIIKENKIVQSSVGPRPGLSKIRKPRHDEIPQ